MQLTVAIPTLNRADWLETCLGKLEAVAAGLAAAGHGLDVLISDNASSDATPQVAAKSRGYPVRVVRRAVKGEIYHSIATALLHGSIGDPDAAMILIGDDDELDLNGIRTALDRLAADPQAIGVAGGIFAIHVDTKTQATVQTCPDPALARLSLNNITDFLDLENYLEIIVARKSAYHYWHMYDGYGLPCHTRALVRFLKGGDIIWLDVALIQKNFHKDNVSRQVLTDYQQIRLVQDRELAFADLFLMDIYRAPQSLFGKALAKDYAGCANLRPVKPYLALLATKRCLGYAWMPTEMLDIESGSITAAAAEAILTLALVSARPGPLLVPQDHPISPLLLGFLQYYGKNYPDLRLAPDEPGATGCLRLVIARRDLVTTPDDPIPRVAFEGVIDSLRLTRRNVSIDGV